MDNTGHLKIHFVLKVHGAKYFPVELFIIYQSVANKKEHTKAKAYKKIKYDFGEGREIFSIKNRI